MTGLDWDAHYRAHHPKLIRYLTWRGADRSLAEDLAQEAFARAIRSEHQFASDGRGIGPWLTTIARNLLLDHAKRSSTRREQVASDAALFENFAVVVASAEETALAGWEAEELVLLRAAFGRLAQPQREVLRLHYWSRLSMAQIGRRTFRSESAVKMLTQRGRAQLRKAVEAA